MFDRKAYLKAYLKEWRKNHPGYSRHYRLMHGGGAARGQRVLLGVLCKWKIYPWREAQP